MSGELYCYAKWVKTSRLTPLFVVSLVIVFLAAMPLLAGSAPRQVVTIKGEILDMGCFISRGLRGQIHRECATKCLANGVPVGLITADSTVYYLSQNHDRAMDPTSYGPPDPFELCRRSPAVIMEITGFVWERKGIKELEVKAARVAPTPPPATP